MGSAFFEVESGKRKSMERNRDFVRKKGGGNGIRGDKKQFIVPRADALLSLSNSAYQTSKLPSRFDSS